MSNGVTWASRWLLTTSVRFLLRLEMGLFQVMKDAVTFFVVSSVVCFHAWSKLGMKEPSCINLTVGKIMKATTQKYLKNKTLSEKKLSRVRRRIIARTLNSEGSTLPKPSLKTWKPRSNSDCWSRCLQTLWPYTVPSGIDRRNRKKQVWQSTVKVFEAAMEQQNVRVHQC